MLNNFLYSNTRSMIPKPKNKQIDSTILIVRPLLNLLPLSERIWYIWCLIIVNNPSTEKLESNN